LSELECLVKKLPYLISAVTIGVFACQLLLAQDTPPAPPTRPADATGICKDGTYSTNANKSGACHGHHGVKEWYATSPASTDTPSTPAPSATPTPAPPTTAATPSPTTQVRTQSQAAAQSAGQSDTPPETQSIKKGPAANAANTPATPGGGPGLVWVNTASHTYHCPGTTFYGKTRHGAYMTEDEAKAKGAHVARGEVCNK
jgi:hypothetical protein